MSNKRHTYIIAEVGQNHNGDIKIAKQLIDMAAMPIMDHFTGDILPGVDAIKFTKRNLSEELTHNAADKPYDSTNSFGKTYLEHRKALELTNEEHKELENYAHSKGLDFVETLCSPGCLELLNTTKVDRIKIASRDITNGWLLEKLSELGKHIIISTGMCTIEELKAAIKVLSKTKKQIDILHCISEYPATYKNINLRSIPYLKGIFPDSIIGYSDHSIGIVVPAAAVALGAEIIEKHITLSRKMKGSDHAGSLEPDGLWRMVRDIRNIENSLGSFDKKYNPAVDNTRRKLARSLAINTYLEKGEILKESMLCMLSPGNGLKWGQKELVIGKKAKKHISPKSLIKKENFE
jgi:sialic acid synthase